MTVRIFEWSNAIYLRTLGPALNNTYRRSRIARDATSRLNQLPSPTRRATPFDLQDYIDLYGEQVTSNAVGDLQLYFQKTQIRGFTSGGLSTQLSPLGIGPGDVRPSITAISVLGEGLAGWYLEGRSLLPLARPIGENADLIFEDNTTGPTKYALVQVKATQQENIIGQMKAAVPQLLQYAYNVAAQAKSDYVCYVIGVIIRQSGDYDIMSLEINLN